MDGPWPHPSAVDLVALDRALAEIPTGELVVIDGLIASAAPDVIGVHAARLQLVALMHMAIGDAAECAALSAVGGVIATSEWLRHRLIELYSLRPDKVQVALPGVDAARCVIGIGWRHRDSVRRLPWRRTKVTTC